MAKTQSPQLKPQWIDTHALGIVKTLQRKGYETYLVGGCVRDLLLEKLPKDFDIATNAKPNDVKRSIYNSYVIGKRFRLVLVKRDDQQFEVATFRRNIREDDDLDELPPGDNVFGKPEEDAFRRDFTINGLFYDPVKQEVIDFVGGLKDLEAGLVRMIGEPNARLIEDPIRMLRAIRLAHMIRFQIEPSLKMAIAENAESLTETALPRRREEILKFLRLNDPSQPFIAAHDLNVMKYLSPQIDSLMNDPENCDTFLTYLCSYKDEQLSTPGELFAALVLAYYRTVVEPDPSKVRKVNDLLEHPQLLALMRDELGMFKYEQKNFAKAVHTLAYLSKKDIFENRRGRRLAIMRSESFPLSMKLSKKDYAISGEDFLYWQDEYMASIEEIENHQKKNQGRKRRRRRPRRKKPSPDQGSDNDTASTEP